MDVGNNRTLTTVTGLFAQYVIFTEEQPLYILCVCVTCNINKSSTPFVAEAFRAVLKLRYSVYNSQLILLALINITIAALQYGAIQQCHVSCPAIQYIAMKPLFISSNMSGYTYTVANSVY